MSILIRQKCQGYLDDLGLNFIHVAVQNKTLTLVGECGAPVLTVSGIKFDTNVPKKSELPDRKSVV